MQLSRTTAAQQLRSVAGRYRQPDVWLASRRATPWPWTEEGKVAAEDSGNRLGRLEAVLFLAREPLNSRKLGQLAELADGTAARTLVRELNRLYDQSGRAFRVEEIAGGYQLLTRPQFAPWLRRLGHVPPELRLSAPAMETLGVVAYRQPVLRANVEAIRGVSCGEILRQLMERELVRIAGRSEELGRPYQYGTTTRFLQTFGLSSLDQLPRADTLRGAASVNANSNRTSDSLTSKEPPMEEDEVTVTMSEQACQNNQQPDRDLATEKPPVAIASNSEDFDYEEDYDNGLDKDGLDKDDGDKDDGDKDDGDKDDGDKDDGDKDDGDKDDGDKDDNDKDDGDKDDG
ncbi:MAG: SMC-Scp complex subunit ScpB, partial [Planctomycetes bacterium]|nr:SMC-Scp complex subunit ScpB [Planctomycetota bacterium]